MIRRAPILAALALASVLAACARPATVPPGGFRDTEAPIASMVAVEMLALAGTWAVAARFGDGAPSFDIPATLDGPGRFTAPGADGRPRQFWLLWADEGYRVAVLGLPSGEEGLILSRQPGGVRADLMRAARDILEWNGYDLARLKEVSP